MSFCAACGEILKPTLHTCWKCGTLRAGVSDPEFGHADRISSAGLVDRFDLIQPTHAVGKFHDEWPRFSLRALMLAISLACILLASMRSEAGHTLATFVLTITIGVPITLVLVEIETWILTAIVNCMQSKARSTIASHLDPLRDTS